MLFTPSGVARGASNLKVSWKANICALFLVITHVRAIHHMDIKPPRKLQTRQSSGTQLVVRNSCESTIWPGLLTQSGNGPGTNGFALSSGTQRSFIVSEDWQGRVWGRTNCSFNGGGTSSTPCGTGDCGNTISCIGTVSNLAERQRYIADDRLGRSAYYPGRIHPGCGRWPHLL